MAAKEQTDLKVGTRLVWIMWPTRNQIDVWRASVSAGPALTLGASDWLDGEEVVPSFTCPVAASFVDLLA